MSKNCTNILPRFCIKTTARPTGARGKALVSLFRNCVNQPALLDDILDKLRKRLGLIGFPCRLVGDNACVKIDVYGIPVLNFPRGLVAFEYRQADVDGVAVKNAGKGGSDNTGNTRRLDGNRRVLPGGTAAKILLGDHNVAGAYLIYKSLVNILHAVGSKLPVRGCIQVSRRDNNVRIDVIAVFMYCTVCVHVNPSFLYKQVKPSPGQ